MMTNEIPAELSEAAIQAGIEAYWKEPTNPAVKFVMIRAAVQAAYKFQLKELGGYDK